MLQPGALPAAVRERRGKEEGARPGTAFLKAPLRTSSKGLLHGLVKTHAMGHLEMPTWSLEIGQALVASSVATWDSTLLLLCLSPEWPSLPGGGGVPQESWPGQRWGDIGSCQSLRVVACRPGAGSAEQLLSSICTCCLPRLCPGRRQVKPGRAQGCLAVTGTAASAATAQACAPEPALPTGGAQDPVLPEAGWRQRSCDVKDAARWQRGQQLPPTAGDDAAAEGGVVTAASHRMPVGAGTHPDNPPRTLTKGLRCPAGPARGSRPEPSASQGPLCWEAWGQLLPQVADARPGECGAGTAASSAQDGPALGFLCQHPFFHPARGACG